jgi:hypothetical protein
MASTTARIAASPILVYKLALMHCDFDLPQFKWTVSLSSIYAATWHWESLSSIRGYIRDHANIKCFISAFTASNVFLNVSYMLSICVAFTIL